LDLKPKYTVQPLGNHDRAAFSCGNDELDRYFLERAARDVREKIAAVFVLVAEADPQIPLGFYTLSSQQIEAGDLPPKLTKKMGRCKHIPATLIGRFAVAQAVQGRHLGEFLLMDALRRSYETTKNVMSFAVVVDTKGEHVEGFYMKYGFLPLCGARYFLPMKTIAGLPALVGK
jgi:hypothetical protein